MYQDAALEAIVEGTCWNIQPQNNCLRVPVTLLETENSSLLGPDGINATHTPHVTPKACLSERSTVLLLCH